MKKKKEKKTPRVRCKDGYIEIDGKCVRLFYDDKTRDTYLQVNRKQCPETTMIVYAKIAEALAGKKGRLVLEETEWDEK